MGKYIDRTGTKYNRLTFIRDTGKRNKHKHLLWDLICDCGKLICRSSQEVVSGNTTSCGCYSKELSSKKGLSRRKYHPMISSAREVWRSGYSDGDISIDDFIRLSQLQCYYCGREPYATFNKSTGRKDASSIQREQGIFTYNGLDRIDSDKCHTINNVVPCCYQCNYAKMDMTTNEFFSLIKMIYEKHLAQLPSLPAHTNFPTTMKSIIGKSPAKNASGQFPTNPPTIGDNIADI